MHILSLDCESNGLHGTIFAIGAVLIDTDDPEKLYNPIDQWGGKVDLRFYEDREEYDPWVVDNVLPHLDDLALFDNRLDMRNEFWEWYVKHNTNNLATWPTIVLADFGVPVEARLFRELIQDDPAQREWKGPYPLHDLGTMLLMVGANPDTVNRRSWWWDMPRFDLKLIEEPLRQHNPVDDALAAARCAVKCLKMIKART